jgi:quinol monooxygenase YgiN
MKNRFSEVKIFQVKPDKLTEFEALAAIVADEQKKQPGCKDIKYVKRFYTIDGVGKP